MHEATPDLRQLSHAVALADHAHFGRAAASVALSQPAFSRSIQSLEGRLGCRLFERNRGRVVPTPFGRTVVERARRLLHDATELQREVRLLKGGDTGELRVSVGTYPADLCLPGALTRLLADHPRLTIRVRVRDWRNIAEDVEGETADLGVGEISEVEGDTRLETELVGRHEILFVCRPGHPLARKPRVTFDEIAAFPLAGTAWPARAASRFPPAPLAAGTVDPASGRFFPAVTVDRAADVKELVRKTDFLTPLTWTQCAPELTAGTLAAVPFSAPWARTHYGFLWRRGRMRTPAALAFAEAVRATEREIAAGEAELARRLR